MRDQLNAALGCQTDEVALALLTQVIELEHPDLNAPDAVYDALHLRATAMLGELQPTTAAEAFLAAQMVGTQRAVMDFLARSTHPGQPHEGIDRNVQRASRLGRLFLDQLEAMAKLKGKAGQQRVVVEYVTVEAGGQAIVGTVIPGGRG